MIKDKLQHTYLVCPVCGRSTIGKLVEDSDKHSILECSNCSVHFAVPFRQARIDHYEDSWETKKVIRLPEKELERADLSPRYRIFFKRVQVNDYPKLLDVGCGLGGFLKAAKKRRFMVFGVEQSLQAILYARSKLGIDNIHHCSLFELPDDYSSFNVITAFEVLEHLDNPRLFVQAMYERLQPSGILYISVPDRDCFEIRLAGERPQSDFPPNHLTRWSTTALDKFLSGWKWQEKRIYHTALEATPLYRAIRTRIFRARSHAFDTQSKASKSFRRGTLIHRTRVIIDCILWYLFPVTQCLGLYGHSLVALCKKPRT